MNVNDPDRDQRWDHAERAETETERLDRNWTALLQELRVVQTGIQVLTGFLLTLPFQQRFELLDAPMRAVYLVTVACALLSTVLLAAPVGLHRLLFRRHKLKTLVSASHWDAIAGMLLLGAALTGVAIVIFNVVAGPPAGWIAGGCAAVALTTLWFLTPLAMRDSGL